MFTLSRTARWCQYLINSAFRSFFWGPVWARGRCRISPPRFLAECCKRQLNQVSFVSLYFRLSTFLICIEFVYLYFPVLFCLSVSVKWFAVKTASEMTYNVSSGALNSTPTNPTFFWGCQKSALIAILKTPSGSARAHTHTHTHTRLTALCPGLPGWAGTRKVKPIWILLKQETVGGNGISWAICKSASHSRQITTPAPHQSPLKFFYRPDALHAAQPTASKHWRRYLLVAPLLILGYDATASSNTTTTPV